MGNKVLADLWLERKFISSSFCPELQESNKWKTRNAVVFQQAHTHCLAVVLSKKKFNKVKHNSDEKLALVPSFYMCDTTENFIKEKRRFTIRIKVFPLGLCEQASFIWYLAVKNQSDRLQLLRVLQKGNIYKLALGSSTTSVDVKIKNTESAKKFYLNELSRYVLVIDHIKVLLVCKLSQAVVSAWPFSCIRNFSSNEPSLFQLESGRNAPCGEGKFQFSSCAADGGRNLFEILQEKTCGMKKVSSSPQSPPEKPPKKSVVTPRKKNVASSPRGPTYSIIIKTPKSKRKNEDSSNSNVTPPLPGRVFRSPLMRNPGSGYEKDLNDLEGFLSHLETLSPTRKDSVKEEQVEKTGHCPRRKLSFNEKDEKNVGAYMSFDDNRK